MRTLRVDDAKDDVDSESLTDDAGAKATELGRVGEIDVATIGELSLVRARRENPARGPRFVPPSGAMHRARSVAKFRATAKAAAH